MTQDKTENKINKEENFLTNIANVNCYTCKRKVWWFSSCFYSLISAIVIFVMSYIIASQKTIPLFLLIICSTLIATGSIFIILLFSLIVWQVVRPTILQYLKTENKEYYFIYDKFSFSYFDGENYLIVYDRFNKKSGLYTFYKNYGLITLDAIFSCNNYNILTDENNNQIFKGSSLKYDINVKAVVNTNNALENMIVDGKLRGDYRHNLSYYSVNETDMPIFIPKQFYDAAKAFDIKNVVNKNIVVTKTDFINNYAKFDKINKKIISKK